MRFATLDRVRALVVGGASWNTLVQLDRFPDPHPHSMSSTRVWDAVGGTGAGKALNLARLGHEVHFVTIVGDDADGRRVAARLQEDGVIVHASRGAGPTTRHVNLMTPDGHRLSLMGREPGPLPAGDLPGVVDLARTCDVSVVNINQFARPVAAALAAAGMPFWTDLQDWDGRNSYHEGFLAADGIVLSALALRDPDAVASDLARTRSVVAVTDGERGCLAWSRGRRYAAPARPVSEVVDTNGAGDAFTAGLLHGLQAGWPLERALAAGAVAGATCVTSSELASAELTADLVERETRAVPVAPA